MIWDIINFAYPTEVGVIEEPTWAVAASINTLMTFGLDGITARDVTDPLNPVTVGYYYYNTTNEWVRDMDILGSYLLTAGGAKFRVYLCDALSGIGSRPEIVPHEFALLPPYPNPFNSTLVIPFTIPVQSKVNISIYNILGQRVDQFDFFTLSPGAHRILWDATAMSSGIYFIKLDSQEKEFIRKTVLLK